VWTTLFLEGDFRHITKKVVIVTLRETGRTQLKSVLYRSGQRAGDVLCKEGKLFKGKVAESSCSFAKKEDTHHVAGTLDSLTHSMDDVLNIGTGITSEKEGS